MCKNEVKKKHFMFHSWTPYLSLLEGTWFVRECIECGKRKSIKYNYKQG